MNEDFKHITVKSECVAVCKIELSSCDYAAIGFIKISAWKYILLHYTTLDGFQFCYRIDYSLTLNYILHSVGKEKGSPDQDLLNLTQNQKNLKVDVEINR